MIDFRKSEIFSGDCFSPFIFLFLSVFFLLLFSQVEITSAKSLFSGNIEEIIPERSLELLDSNIVNIPPWSQEWQAARALVRNKNYKRAATMYAQLLKKKPELEAVRWEYCQILGLLRRYEEARDNIDTLLAFAPDRKEYRLFAGAIALHNGEFKKAALNFGMVLELASPGSLSLSAMQGLAESLRLQGKKELSLSLEEQQILGQNAEHFSPQTEPLPLLRKGYDRLLDDALSLDDTAKVEWIVTHLSSLESLKDSQLRAVLSLLDNSETRSSALKLVYQEFMRRFPGDQILRKQFISFLLLKEQYHKALEQYDKAFEYSKDDLLLLSAAELARGKANVPGKALGYYQRYLQRHPQDQIIQKEISSLHILLAKDFLAIVENDGINALWLDMEPLGQDRTEIFLQMAELLRARTRKESQHLAAVVLQFLVQNSITDKRIYLSLTDVYMQQENWDKALTALNNVPLLQRQEIYYVKRAELAFKQQDELEMLDAYSHLLKLNPKREDIRQKAIVLAGALGLIEKAEEYFAFYSKGTAHRNNVSPSQKNKNNEQKEFQKKPQLSTLLLYLYFLGENRQFDSLQDVTSWAARLWDKEPGKLVSIRIEEANALRRQGFFNLADQILREQLNRKVSQDAVFFALANNAADRGRKSEMELWLAFLASNTFSETRVYSKDVTSILHSLIRVRYALRRQVPERAENLLKNIPISTQQITSIAAEEGEVQRAVAEICQLSEIISAQELRPYCRLHNESPLTPWGNAPQISFAVQKKTPELLSSHVFRGKQQVLRKAYDDAQKTLEPVHKQIPTSFLTTVLLAEVAAGQNRYSEAEKIIQSLNGDLGTRCQEEIRLTSSAGKHQQALSHFYNYYGDIDGGEDPVLAVRLFTGNQPKEAVLLARLLWNAEKFQEALSVYQAILSVPVTEEVLTYYKQRMKGDFPGVSQEKSFWSFLSIIRFSKEEQTKTLNALLSPHLLVENAGNSVGVMLAGNSLLLSLQKRLVQEYDARIASYEKRYHYAEKSYKNLLEEEHSLDALTDLVTIYERMGKYQKEAKVYRDIEQSGKLSPVLEESMERNLQKIAPFAMVDFSLSKKKNLHRYQDIEKTGLKTSFSYLLDLDRFINFHYKNVRYSSHNGEKKTGANCIGGDIFWQFDNILEFSGGMGVDKQNSAGDTTLLYYGRLESQLDDLVTGFVEFSRSQIDDTVDSFDENLTTKTLHTGLTFETAVGVRFGTDFQYNMRSDDNNGKEIHGFLAYSFFFDESQVEFSYDAFYQNNDKKNPEYKNDNKELILTGGPISYWSPDSYSQHRLGGRFQYDFGVFATEHSFQSEKKNSWLKNSFVAVELGIGLEDEEEYVYSADFDISLEINSHCLLKSGLGFSRGKEIEEMHFFTALQYRW